MTVRIKSDSNSNSHQRMKQENRVQVLTLLHQEPLLSRVELAERTGLTKQTVTNIIQELLTQDLVMEASTREADSAGRRPILLRLRGETLLSAGIQVTRSHIRGLILNHDALVLYEAQVSLDSSLMDRDDCGAYVVSSIRGMIHRLLGELPGEGHFLGIGIGLQGIIDGSGGIVKFSRYLKLFDYPMEEIFRSEFPFPICVDNLVRAFAAGEVWFHNRRELKHVLCVYLDQAVGGAILVDGKLYTGSDWQAAKFGHTKVVRGGKLCRCGKKGCLEAHISIPVILSQLGHRYSTMDELVLHMESEEVRQLMDESGRHLGFALGNAINLLNPECVIIGGELTKAGPWFERAMREEMVETISIPNDRTPVFITHYDQNNGSIGAAALVFNRWIREPAQMNAAEVKAWAKMQQ
ncbi:ROK family transcriptional regulator [Paenibacillus radicis (ex Xue et al. 2023)]|uniref:ROK family transcriptional regulator n=1 Tax=Paenibacillus radicis (ex Xue et al. 2023) TaxID=2972489 RepID=A0ABT1Y9G5_9BACL|nr:ROK family transcriptional regulator [Paenibacillus radicis (ex Xue et al. 2023)]MCR8629821.1 ROK family transcriptional regulator [Paenibacillus radicis (ex Xue et al. 2023)]